MNFFRKFFRMISICMPERNFEIRSAFWVRFANLFICAIKLVTIDRETICSYQWILVWFSVFTFHKLTNIMLKTPQQGGWVWKRLEVIYADRTHYANFLVGGPGENPCKRRNALLLSCFMQDAFRFEYPMGHTYLSLLHITLRGKENKFAAVSFAK
jgi:hypothetical protein